MTRIAHLEISPRQTGKTHRLMLAAMRHAGDGQPTVFVSSLARHLRPQLERHGIVTIRDGNAEVPETHRAANAVWLYDEFDWIEGVKVREGAYYATTARYLRSAEDLFEGDDILARLLRANGWRCEKHFMNAPPVYRYMAVDFRRATDPDAFRCLVLGEYLK